MIGLLLSRLLLPSRGFIKGGGLDIIALAWRSREGVRHVGRESDRRGAATTEGRAIVHVGVFPATKTGAKHGGG